MSDEQAFLQLTKTIRTLVDPEKGCPWDKEQDFESLRSFMIEEAYEAAHAATEDDPLAFAEELGDVLLQVILNAAIAEKKNLFTLRDVINAIDSKMRRRHPHVFTNPSNPSIDELKEQWSDIKAREGKATGPTNDKSIPATLAAVKIGRKCPDFDWSRTSEVLHQVEQELIELREAIQSNDAKRIEDELGDTFFSLCQLARWLDLSPEVSTYLANEKFLSRYKKLLSILETRNQKLSSLSHEEKQSLWDEAKMKLKQDS
jgi:MazG family protein